MNKTILGAILAGNFGQFLLDNLIFFTLIVLCLGAIVAILTVLHVATKRAAAENPAAPTDDETPVEDNASVENKTDTCPTETTKTVETPIVRQEKSEPEESSAAEESIETTIEERAEEETVLAETHDDAQNESEPEQPTEPKHYNGKWVLSQIDVRGQDGETKESAFFFSLKASNGETLLTSEDYATARGAVIAIETFKNNIKADRFRISSTKKGTFVVKLLNAQGFLLARGEQYPTRYAAMNAIGSIRRFAATAVRSNDVQHSILSEDDTPMPEKNIDKSKKGKWVLHTVREEETGETSYLFELRASNGQTLLTSEEYASANGAKNGIVTHKSNIAAGNIRAAITRNGDYALKVYTADGKLLALGEHYRSKAQCLSAIESVKRFAATGDIEITE